MVCFFVLMPGFTHCKSLLEDGPRYENLAWRLWHQRAKSPILPLPSHAPLSAENIGKVQNPFYLPAVLSEPELSTDGSCTSDGSSSGFKENEFKHVMPKVLTKQTWADELVEMAREAGSRHSHSTLSSAQDNEHDVAVDDDETVLGYETRSAGTPISTSGTITPHGMRSRANSLATSPRNVMISPQGPKPSVADARLQSASLASSMVPPAVTVHAAQPSRMPHATTARSNLPSITEKSEAPTKSATTTSLAGRQRRGRGLKSVENLTAIRGNGKPVSRNSMLQMLGPTEDGTKRDKLKNKRKKAKIIFTVGDVSDEEDSKSSTAANDEDEWASEDEEEEQRRRAAEEAAEKEQRAKEEEAERIDMFRKRPIRSVSLADLNMVEKVAQNAPHLLPPPESGLTRGLLSTMFHTADTNHTRGASVSGPGRVGRSLRLSQLPPRMDGHEQGRNMSVPALAQSRSTNKLSKISQGPNLERSKSVIALPLLDLTSLRSSTATARSESPESTVTRDDQCSVAGNDDEAHSPVNRTKSSNALARLSAIAQRGASENEPRRLASLVRSYSAIGNLMTVKSTVPPSPTLNEDEEGPSLAVQADDTQPRVTRVPQPELVATLHQDEPDAEGHSTPVADVRAPVPSPHNARETMMYNELSESLKQNLIWERQSRARILGLTPARPPEGRRASSGGDMWPTVKKAQEDESFHHKGW